MVMMTVVRLGGSFNLAYRFVIWQVIWAIRWSMVALSALIFLPWRVLLAYSAVMIADTMRWTTSPVGDVSARSPILSYL
jgi:uncharacterized membrane protein